MCLYLFTTYYDKTGLVPNNTNHCVIILILHNNYSTFRYLIMYIATIEFDLHRNKCQSARYTVNNYLTITITITITRKYITNVPIPSAPYY